MKSTIVKSLIAILVVTGVLSLAACNTIKGTVHGANEDMNDLDKSLNPPQHKTTTQASTETTQTANQLTSKIGATNAPIKKTDSDIPEESY